MFIIMMIFINIKISIYLLILIINNITYLIHQPNILFIFIDLCISYSIQLNYLYNRTMAVTINNDNQIYIIIYFNHSFYHASYLLLTQVIYT